MKVLLDENLPVKLKQKFSQAIQVYTVYDMQWNSLKNGELLKSIGENNFDALITSDKNIIHQHKLSKYPFRFVIIKTRDNQFETLRPLVSMIEEMLLSPGEQVIHINAR
jgi:predicted nuclease of predicted toxin-antitoxin system